MCKIYKINLLSSDTIYKYTNQVDIADVIKCRQKNFMMKLQTYSNLVIGRLCSVNVYWLYCVHCLTFIVHIRLLCLFLATVVFVEIKISNKLTCHAVTIGRWWYIYCVDLIGESRHFKQFVDLLSTQLWVVLEEHDAVLDRQVGRRCSEVPCILEVVVVEHKQRISTDATDTSCDTAVCTVLLWTTHLSPALQLYFHSVKSFIRLETKYYSKITTGPNVTFFLFSTSYICSKNVGWGWKLGHTGTHCIHCLLYTSPSPRD